MTHLRSIALSAKITKKLLFGEIMVRTTHFAMIIAIAILLSITSGCGETNEYIKELKSKEIAVTQERFLSAIASGERDITELFLLAWEDDEEIKAELAAFDPVRSAHENGYHDIAFLLIDAGFKSTLIEAVATGHLTRVEALLNDGVDINAEDRNGYSALMWVASIGNAEIAQMLLDAGAEPQNSAFVLAESGNHTDVLKALSKVIISRDLNFIFSDNLLSQPLPIATSSYPKTQFGEFSAKEAFDGDLITSWVEAADGSGVGEMMLFSIPMGQNYIEIVPGYGDPRVFNINNRVKRAELTLYAAAYTWRTNWNDSLVLLKKLHTQSLEFKDTNKFQRFPLNASSSWEHPYNALLGLLTIADVYAGRDEDLSIAEIQFQSHGFIKYVGAYFWNSKPIVSDESSKFIFRRDKTFSFEPGGISRTESPYSGTWKEIDDELQLEIMARSGRTLQNPDKRQIRIGPVTYDEKQRELSMLFDDTVWWALPDPDPAISDEPYLETPVFLFWGDGKPYYFLTDGTYLEAPRTISDRVDKGFHFISSNDGRFIIYISDFFDGEWHDGAEELGFLRGYDISVLSKGQRYRLFGISPNNQFLLFSIRDDSSEDLNVMDISDKNRNAANYTFLTRLQGGWKDKVFWLNENEIVIRRQNGNIELTSINISTKEETAIIKIDNSADVDYMSSTGRLMLLENRSPVGFVDIKQKQIARFPESMSEGSGYTWSPDGSKFAYFRSKKKDGRYSFGLVIVNADDFSTAIFPELSGGYPESLGWFDNFRFAFGINSDEEDVSRGLYIARVDSDDVVHINNMDVYDFPLVACPHLFIHDGSQFTEIGEIMGTHIDAWSEKSELVPIAPEFIIGNKLKIRIDEFLDEITYLNSVSIIVDGDRIYATNSPEALIEQDDEYLVLRRGESRDLEFDLPASVPAKEVVLDSVGYYEPLNER